jgi:hypothetical protein
MRYAVEMGPHIMIYVYTKLHNYWFRHSKVNRGKDSQTYRQQGDFKKPNSIFSK